MINLANVPIWRQLSKYIKQNPIPFHMPGHKMGVFFEDHLAYKLEKFDLTEISATDNLHNPKGCIKEAEELLKSAYKSDKSYFLVNGSTSGIMASILSCCNHYDRAIVSRDCHSSVFNGLGLAGAQPIYFYPEISHEFGVPIKIDKDKVLKIIESNSDAKCIILTRPNYYGICYDIGKIIEVAQKQGILVIIDEAHGAHLNFNSLLPQSSIDMGADIVIQSAHKTLPALTQGAYLHIKGRSVDLEKLEYYLKSLQTTSPSFILMMYLDLAREFMQSFGDKKLGQLINMIESFHKKLKGLYGYKILSEANLLEGDFDITRLVINVRHYNMCGKYVEKILYERYKIQVEMSDLNNIVCIGTIADKKYFYDNLYRALKEISMNLKVEEDFQKIEIPFFVLENILNIKEAIANKGKRISYLESDNTISKDFIIPYPPGIPLICPGERLNSKVIDAIRIYLDNGMDVLGLSDNKEINVIN